MKIQFKKIKLQDACEVFVDGDWIESKDQSTEGIRLVQTGNIGFGIFKDKDDKARYISEEVFKRLKCTEILPGDLLVSRLPDPVGKSCIIPNLNSKMITGVDCTIIRPKEVLKSEFLCYYQMSQEYLDDVNLRVSGATRSRISRKNLGLIEIPLPPLPEQQRIVSILDDAFAKIDKAKANYEQNLRNAKELFKSYLEPIFKMKGEGWLEKSFADIYDVRDGTHDSPKYQTDGYALVTSKNLKNGSLDLYNVNYISEIDYMNINRRSNVSKGDILFAMIGTIGNPVVIMTEPNFAIKNVALFKVPSCQDSYFLKYLLSTKTVINRMRSDAKGTTQKFVGLNYLRNFRIFIPPLEQQRAIVKKLDRLSFETKKLESIYSKKIEDLEEFRKSLLQKAFSGELTANEVTLADV
ncbi:MAG: restriction endonuclease subunit S [Flavobacterium sp.]|nr:MAG: restriction endonuclease subunit S [Flavobacterium sp.]